MFTTELGDVNVDKQRIVQRVREWHERLLELYSRIQQWLPRDLGYEIDTSGQTLMNEELMSKYDVEPVNLPTLKIKRNDDIVLLFQPKGLWVIGANGRVDVFGKNSNWLLVDFSEQFSAHTDWKLAIPEDRRNFIDFTEPAFLEMLAE